LFAHPGWHVSAYGIVAMQSSVAQRLTANNHKKPTSP